MGMIPKILNGKVMHGRLFPKSNSFTYGIYYLAVPLSRMNELDNGWRFGVNRPALAAFHEKDHGARDGSCLERWAQDILKNHNIKADGDIVLVTMPRVLGHVFNPVSFWLCYDAAGALRAVLCEVNNTFGEKHTYICAPQDGTPVENTTWLTAQKLFHVSPFLERDGHYKFRFDAGDDYFAAAIDYYDGDGRKQLVTSLRGDLAPYSPSGMRRAFWRHPMVCLVALARIHLQAARLVFKGIRYIPKPEQLGENITKGSKITNL